MRKIRGRTITMKAMALAVAMLAVSPAAADGTTGLELSTKKPIRLDQPAIIQVQITNNSSQSLEFGSTVGTVEADFSVSLLRADGGTVSKTDYGRALAGQYSGPDDPAQNYSSSGGSYETIRLMPGETLAERINLSKIFQIDRRGRYKVQIERRFSDDPSAEAARSNTLFFSVQ